MSDRRKDLERHRALAQEQLAWIESEIARESGQTPAQPAAPVPPAPPAAEATRMADEILARYQREAAASPGNVKRGCVVYFIFALGALVIFAVGAYFLYVNLRNIL